jgi:hypothetical protein
MYSLLEFVQNYAEFFLFHFVSTLIPKLNCVVSGITIHSSGKMGRMLKIRLQHRCLNNLRSQDQALNTRSY